MGEFQLLAERFYHSKTRKGKRGSKKIKEFDQ